MKKDFLNSHMGKEDSEYSMCNIKINIIRTGHVYIIRIKMQKGKMFKKYLTDGREYPYNNFKTLCTAHKSTVQTEQTTENPWGRANIMATDEQRIATDIGSIATDKGRICGTVVTIVPWVYFFT